MSTPTPDNLSALTSEASDAVKKQARNKVARRPARVRPIGALLAVAAAIVLAYVAHRSFSPPSQERIEQDLSQIVDQARASIEASRQATGALPEAIPNAALSSLVQYELKGDGYQLTVAVRGVRVTLAPDGTRQLDRGAQP